MAQGKDRAMAHPAGKLEREQIEQQIGLCQHRMLAGRARHRFQIGGEPGREGRACRFGILACPAARGRDHTCGDGGFPVGLADQPAMQAHLAIVVDREDRPGHRALFGRVVAVKRPGERIEVSLPFGIEHIGIRQFGQFRVALGLGFGQIALDRIDPRREPLLDLGPGHMRLRTGLDPCPCATRHHGGGGRVELFGGQPVEQRGIGQVPPVLEQVMGDAPARRGIGIEADEPRAPVGLPDRLGHHETPQAVFRQPPGAQPVERLGDAGSVLRKREDLRMFEGDLAARSAAMTSSGSPASARRRRIWASLCPKASAISARLAPRPCMARYSTISSAAGTGSIR